MGRQEPELTYGYTGPLPDDPPPRNRRDRIFACIFWLGVVPGVCVIMVPAAIKWGFAATVRAIGRATQWSPK